MRITKEKAIEMLKQGDLLSEEIWGGYHYRIAGYSICFGTARKLIQLGLIIEDKTKHKSPALKWYRWNIEGK